jgi:spore maturation protein CgeB
LASAKDAPKNSPKTVLIAGPPFRGYLNSIGDGFRLWGVEPSFHEWLYPRRNLGQEVMYYSSRRYRLRRATTQDDANAISLEKAVQESRPDLVLVMKAVDLTPGTMELCKREGIRTVLWAYDSVTEFPIISRVASKYDLVYTYEPADIDALSRDCAPRVLPMAFDPKCYARSNAASEKDIDICFVGSIDRYPQRRRLLRIVADGLRKKRIGIWTDSIHWYSHRHVGDFILAGFRKNISLTRKTLDHAEINGVYNRSRICLNIHHAQSKRALNPRTFEILGAGGLLLTDRRLDDIEGFEDGDGYLYYSNEAEMLARIDEVLHDEKRAAATAEKGCSRAQVHTYEQRVRTILMDLRTIPDGA